MHLFVYINVYKNIWVLDIQKSNNITPYPIKHPMLMSGIAG